MDSNLRKKDSNPLKNIQVQEMKRMKLDSNLLHSDSNLKIWRCEEHMKDSKPRKMDSNPIYKMKLKIKLKDSNLRVTDLNPILACNSNFTKEIRIPEK